MSFAVDQYEQGYETGFDAGRDKGEFYGQELLAEAIKKILYNNLGNKEMMLLGSQASDIDKETATQTIVKIHRLIQGFL